jgi:hypothetical protein
MSVDFDFGFTLVDEGELEVSKALETSDKESAKLKAERVLESAKATATQEKVDALYNAMAPLLNNLKANPEKEYILWPNRVEKVEEFEDYLREIYTQ